MILYEDDVFISPRSTCFLLANNHGVKILLLWKILHFGCFSKLYQVKLDVGSYRSTAFQMKMWIVSVQKPADPKYRFER